jgi:hypothetical protein
MADKEAISSTSEECDTFHFVTCETGSPRALDKSARRYLVKSKGVPSKKDRNLRRDESRSSCGTDSPHAKSLGSFTGSWRLKKLQKKNTEENRSSKRSSAESRMQDDLTAAMTTPHSSVTNDDISFCAVSLQPRIVSTDPFGCFAVKVTPHVLALLRYFAHLVDTWRYPADFRTRFDSPVLSEPCSDLQNCFHNESNSLTTLAVASIHLEMYKREFNSCRADSKIAVSKTWSLYLHMKSVEAVRLDMLRRDPSHDPIWVSTVCKLALVDLFWNHFSAARLHLAAIAKVAGPNVGNVETVFKN